jgi:hypothetical protein
MFADETYITYDDIEELPLGSLGAIRLAVLLGCYTWDFADLFVSKGARVVVGFEGTVNSRGQVLEWQILGVSNKRRNQNPAVSAQEAANRVAAHFGFKMWDFLDIPKLLALPADWAPFNLE